METLEQLSALSDEELINRIATEVMGWHRLPGEWKGIIWEDADGKIHDGRWNPLTDWNHTMEVVEKMKPTPYKREFAGHLQAMTGDIKAQLSKIDAYMFASQREICIAALLAVQ